MQINVNLREKDDVIALFGKLKIDFIYCDHFSVLKMVES